MLTKRLQGILMALAVTLIMMVALTAPAYTFSPPAHKPPPAETDTQPSEQAPIDSQKQSPMSDSTRSGVVEYAQLTALIPNLAVSQESIAPLPVDHSLKLETYASILEQLETRSDNTSPRESTTCTVNTAADNGAGSLRQCLLDAAISDTIDFDPQVFPPMSPVTITLSSALPFIITDSLTIDGSNAGIILNGSQLTNAFGLVIAQADGVIIQGLQLINFPGDGIALVGAVSNTMIGGDRSIGSGALGQGNLISNNGSTGVILWGAQVSNNTIMGNYIGTDLSGTSAFGNEIAGLVIASGSHDNVIGGESDTGNLISGNGLGIYILDHGSNNNHILGNYIGTDSTGMAPLANMEGIVIANGAQNNVIGAHTQQARNLISGNSGRGIIIQQKGSTSNQVQGNYIGTNLIGTEAITNTYGGVAILAGASDNLIGGDTLEARNLISGNGTGIVIANQGTSENQILGNYIGTDVTGTDSLGNMVGIGIAEKASQNHIGGETFGTGNLISGNSFIGVALSDEGTSDNWVRGNRVGTDYSGQEPLPNLLLGVGIGISATNNIIGGNLISGNGQNGIELSVEAAQNEVSDNYIGTNISGTEALPNGVLGMIIGRGAQDNTIESNIISGNNGPGLIIQNLNTSGNQVLGNYIGTDATGTVAISNTLAGISIGYGATNNDIGRDTTEARNLISGNGGVGIQLQISSTIGNQITGNYIGTDATGTQALGNAFGVEIIEAANQNTMTGNLISGNQLGGIYLAGEQTTANQITNNHIGTDVTGKEAIPNGGTGIYLDGATSNMIGSSNTIAYNSSAGLFIAENTFGNTVTGNRIYENDGLPIEWDDTSIPSPPTLITYSYKALMGTACDNCRLEIFAGESKTTPEARLFLGATTADESGAFALSWNNDPPVYCLSATATDSEGNTSEFSDVLSCEPTAIRITSITADIPQSFLPSLLCVVAILGLWLVVRASALPGLKR